jgi:hypothetical protein
MTTRFYAVNQFSTLWPGCATAAPRSVADIQPGIILRTLLAQALQAEWISVEEGTAVMRWLNQLDSPREDRRLPRGSGATGEALLQSELSAV